LRLKSLLFPPTLKYLLFSYHTFLQIKCKGTAEIIQVVFLCGSIFFAVRYTFLLSRCEIAELSAYWFFIPEKFKCPEKKGRSITVYMVKNHADQKGLRFLSNCLFRS
ncbi:MAG: hypothetical protein LBG80_17005, partial [Bacteroidales bacterium]|nr:hypothetical protein [Bacteroidales bacterium]